MTNVKRDLLIEIRWPFYQRYGKARARQLILPRSHANQEVTGSVALASETIDEEGDAELRARDEIVAFGGTRNYLPTAPLDGVIGGELRDFPTPERRH